MTTHNTKQTLIITSPNENNLHTIATRTILALNGWSEMSKHNLEIPAETELSDLLRPTAGKQRLLLKFSNSVTQNGALQAQAHNKIKPHQNPCCSAPDTPTATRLSLALNGRKENPNII
jgi:hypothetical protein